jgi:hypothetical protein
VTATAAARTAGLRGQIADAIGRVTFPDSIVVVGFTLLLGDSASRDVLRLMYVAPETLTTQVGQIITRQLDRELSLPRLRVEPEFISMQPRTLSARDEPALDTLAALVGRNPRLRLEVIAGARARPGDAETVVARLGRTASGLDSGRLAVVRSATARGVAVRVQLR